MKVFSVKCTETHKIFNILGIKIKIRRARKLTKQEKEWLKKLVELYSLPLINRDEIESKVENMRHYGLNTEPRTPRIIVTLTSYPKRMYDIHLCLYSLLTQDFKPDKVVLWLGEDLFPEKELDVPRKVKELCRFGLEIRWCKDMRSFTKLMPSLKEYPDDYLVTADDDRFYQPDWLRKLWDGYCRSGTITALYAKAITFSNGQPMHYNSWIWGGTEMRTTKRNMQFGFGGVLYPPHCLHPEVHRIDKAMQLCPTADDVWFWCMSVLNNTPIYLIPGCYVTYFTNGFRELNMNQDGTLHALNEHETCRNEDQLQNMYREYPQLIPLLRDEVNENPVFQSQ